MCLKSRAHMLFKLFMTSHFFWFCGVGLLTAVVYFGSFAFLFQKVHLPYGLALSFAYLLAVGVNFSGNRYLSFKQKNKANFFGQLVRYAVMLLFNYGVTVSIVFIVVHYGHFSPYVGMVVSTLLTIGSGFLMGKLWVFSY
jgi:putative flippase GtrA